MFSFTNKRARVINTLPNHHNVKLIRIIIITSIGNYNWRAGRSRTYNKYVCKVSTVFLLYTLLHVPKFSLCFPLIQSNKPSQ